MTLGLQSEHDLKALWNALVLWWRSSASRAAANIGEAALSLLCGNCVAFRALYARLIPNWTESGPGRWELAARSAYPLPLLWNGRWSRILGSTNLSTVLLQSGIALSLGAPRRGALKIRQSNQTSALAEPPTIGAERWSAMRPCVYDAMTDVLGRHAQSGHAGGYLSSA